MKLFTNQSELSVLPSGISVRVIDNHFYTAYEPVRIECNSIGVLQQLSNPTQKQVNN